MPLQFVMLAQSDSTTFKFVILFAIVLGGLVLPFMIGNYLQRKLRMDKYGWKIGLILASVIMSIVVIARVYNPETNTFDFKLGVDLKGGVILIYEVDDDASVVTAEGDNDGGNSGSLNMSALVEALSRRINPSGTKEIVIRPYGERQVEIIIPEVDQREVEQIKKGISTAGVLQFRIVANERDHLDLIKRAREMSTDPLKRRGRIVRNEQNEPVALWARLARDSGEADELRPFKQSPGDGLVRDASTGELLDITGHRGDDGAQFAQYVSDLGIKEVDILMETDDGYDVTGAHLGSTSMGSDQFLNPCIYFNLKGEGIDRFAGLTREFSPQGNFERQLGILLDNELLSAPNINEMIQGRGQITGRFTEDEVAFMVNILQAGSLPVVLNKVPISENLIDPLLGAETVKQGKWAITISISMVLVFIVFYYRFSGVVACLALIANLLFILALMVSIQAAMTLPGLAGLVLTVGMSVDANVLIFERIREELARGAALRMAIRNGFSRATTTIVDANLTTLITAIVLYAIGTDQIRGFAVTLILGILMSMYTAIFCSRVIFDIAERSWRMSKLNMTQILGATQIDFIGKRKVAAACSLLLIAVGIVALVGRGADIFDIDFRGGTSVHMMFAEPVPTDVVRKKLADKFDPENIRFTVTAMNNTGGASANEIFKVDSSLPEVDQLQSAVKEIFSDGPRLATYSLNSGTLRTVALATRPPQATPPQATPPQATPPGDSPSNLEKAEPAADDQGSLINGAESQIAFADEVADVLAQASTDATPAATESAPEDPPTTETPAAETPAAETPAAETPAAETPAAETPAAETPAAETPAAETPAAETPAAETPAAGTPAAGESTASESTTAVPPEPPASSTTTDADAAAQVEVDLEFGHAINAQTLRKEIEEAADELSVPLSYFVLENSAWDGDSSNSFTSWTLRVAATKADTQQVLDHLQDRFSKSPVWPSSSKIGGQVADRMQNKAIAALVTSLFGIVVYIWIRFQRVIFGLAAVVALIHDVLMTLGAIAISAWLAGSLGFLLIEEFKISLPIVAALLTIIGYSLNDTIVVFDRIREVRGKSPDLTGDMINQSINQTLSRTLLTSLTTLIVVIVLYAIGGQGIHGFAFALVVGVIVGTYSSIFVASPTLLWMTGTGKQVKRKSVAA